LEYPSASTQNLIGRSRITWLTDRIRLTFFVNAGEGTDWLTIGVSYLGQALHRFLHATLRQCLKDGLLAYRVLISMPSLDGDEWLRGLV
jgi:hypothetical protein